MEQLLKIDTSKDGHIVSARDLYNFLSPTERFSRWMERQFQYGFEEGIDYTGCEQFNTLANQNLDDYALTLNTAKEISMLQKSEKGKIARKYFIECEKKLNSQQKLSRKELAYMVIEAEEKAERLQLEIDTKHLPRSQFVDQVFNSDSLITIGQAAKLLGLEFGRNTLFKKLREKGVLFKNTNEPKQEYVDRGYFEIKENTYKDKVSIQTFVTQKGLAYIAKIFNVVNVPLNRAKVLSA